MPTILEGVKVLDFTTGMAGSLATMLMSDNGAEVIKVEPPKGDPFRSMPAWLMWNRGKKSVVLDLKSNEGREAARKLAQQVDVLVENFGPGGADGLGIGYDTLARLNAGLIYCSITAMGSKGAYKNLKPYDGVVDAKVGGFLQLKAWMMRDGPIYRARPNGSWGTANVAVQGIIAALRVRDKTGQGQRLDTSLYQGITCYDSSSSLVRQAELGTSNFLDPNANLGVSSIDPGAIGAPVAARWQGRALGVNLPYLVVRSKDGKWMQMVNLAMRLFPHWMDAIGLGHIFQDPRFKGAPFEFPSDEDRLTLRRMILEKMQEKTFDEWMVIFKEKDVGGDEFLTTQQAMDHPQVIHNGGVVEIEDPKVGKTKQIGPLVRFRETPSVIKGPAPLLGQHTKEVLESIKAPAPVAARAQNPSRSTNNLPKHPLEGILLLDFSAWLASPFGASLMADLGVRVIKIEPPTGDEFRGATRGRGRTFQGKESMVIDLKTEEGVKIIHSLIAKADGLLHNFRGDAPKRIKIDYETVRQVNPNIVYLYAASYGSTGPGAGRAFFHPTGGALSGGVLWQLGKGNEPPPNDEPLDMDQIIEWSQRLYRANEGSPDVTSAIAVGTALALGLYAKERTGKGQYLETCMLISNCYMCSEDFIRYEGKPPRPEPDRYIRGLNALYRLYRTADSWVFLGCQLQEEWEALCRAIGREDLASDPRFVTPEARLVHDDKLMATLGLVFPQRTADEWEAYLLSKDVPCVRADKQSYEDFFLTDPVLQENGSVTTVEHPTTGRMMRQGPAVQFSLTPSRAEPAHAFGEDTPKILAELGLSQEEILRLKEKGVVTWEEPEVAVGARR